MRLFYAAGGPADLAEAHACFVAERQFPNDVCQPFSGQIESACARLGAPLAMVSPNGNMAQVHTEQVTIEPMPKRAASGWRYYAEELRYALQLLKGARAHRADIALLDSGCIQFFLMSFFRVCGIEVIPVLHNTIWPAGFVRSGPKLTQWLDDLFFRRVPFAVIGVSPECIRQLEMVAPHHRYPVREIRAQFPRDFFADIPPPPPHHQHPFCVMYVGRIEQAKGVLDIIEMARLIERSHPGRVRWAICGRGSALQEVRERIVDYGLGPVVDVRGWISLEELQSVYARSHASIVPTRSGFCEGMAMTAAEAILAGRPLITNSIVPALEILRPACEEAIPEDVDSHAQAVLNLALNGDLWEEKRRACAALQEPFYDEHRSLTAAVCDLLTRDRVESIVTRPESARLKAPG